MSGRLGQNAVMIAMPSDIHRSPVLIRLGRARDRLRLMEEPAPPVAALAREAQLSTGEFIRRFAGVFGETPHQYRIRARLERARELLTRGGVSVTEICLEVGFSSLGSFSTLFTRRFGVAPGAYRRRTQVLLALPPDSPIALSPGCLSLMVGAFAQMGVRSRNFGEAAGGLQVSPCVVTDATCEETHEDHAQQHPG